MRVDGKRFLWRHDDFQEKEAETGGAAWRVYGFDFRLPCARHDFGYRNYKAVGGFAGNKSRIDNLFCADLSRSCSAYPSVLRPACDALAWVYYQAVKEFGSVIVSVGDLNRARTLLPGARSSAG